MKRSIACIFAGLVLMTAFQRPSALVLGIGLVLMIGGTLAVVGLWVLEAARLQNYNLELRLELSREKVVVQNDNNPAIDGIPAWFIADFLSNCGAAYLCPIRHYNDGVVREYAIKLTRLLVGRGWAENAAGNLAAKWIDRNAAFAYLSPAKTSVRGLRACDITPTWTDNLGGGVDETTEE